MAYTPLYTHREATRHIYTVIHTQGGYLGTYTTLYTPREAYLPGYTPTHPGRHTYPGIPPYTHPGRLHTRVIYSLYTQGGYIPGLYFLYTPRKATYPGIPSYMPP